MTGDASGNCQRKVQRELTGQEREELAERLATVPQRKRTETLWASRQGQDFLGMVQDLRDSGVPVRWMAEAIGLDERILTQVLREQRNREAGRNPRKR